MEPSDLLWRIVEVLRRCGIPHFITGSMASIFYGEPRLTNDIDVVVRLGMGMIGQLQGELSAPEFYFEPESATHALLHGSQFNVIHPASGLKIDFMIASDSDFDRERFAAVHHVQIAPDRAVPIASPEHVILKKLQFYRAGGSEKHLRDISGILRVSGAEVSRTEIARWASTLGVADLWHEIEQRNPAGGG